MLLWYLVVNGIFIWCTDTYKLTARHLMFCCYIVADVMYLLQINDRKQFQHCCWQHQLVKCCSEAVSGAGRANLQRAFLLIVEMCQQSRLSASSWINFILDGPRA